MSNKQNQLNKKGILALKEEYEKQLRHHEEQFQKDLKRKTVSYAQGLTEGQKIILENIVQDLEELLK